MALEWTLLDMMKDRSHKRMCGPSKEVDYGDPKGQKAS